MAIDIYFSNRTLSASSHALCRDYRRDALAVRQWVERPEGGRRAEHVVRLRAGAPQPAVAGFTGRWPGAPTEAAYAARLGGAEYDTDGELVAEHATPRFLGFLSREEFDAVVRRAEDVDLTTAWTEWQGLPGPAGTKFASRADALCNECLVKDLSWAACNPRLCTAASMPYLAAGLAIAIDRGTQQDQAPSATSHYRETIAELLGFYEVQPGAPTPRLDRARAQRVHAENVEANADVQWPDDHPIANELLEALLFRESPITPDEAGFLLLRLQALTYLMSQTVEEQDGQIKRTAYRALTTMGTYVRCLRIAQRFGLEMYLVAA
jgi:hypothetical protein